MKTTRFQTLLFATACLLMARIADAQMPELSPLQVALAESAEAGQFTFVVFHREESAALRTMHRVAMDGAAARSEQAAVATAHVDDPAEAALVARFGISRAPMPMTVVVAPNGAVTGLFSRQVTDEQLATSIVSPTMMQCMKDLQDQKLVFVCVTLNDECEVPPGVQGIQQDPHFAERVSLVALRADDPAEAVLCQQLQLDGQQIDGPFAALIAPPGVLIGHFNATHTADDIGAAIHHAGRCCDDPNCRHNRQNAPR